jgi:hypothetical protein
MFRTESRRLSFAWYCFTPFLKMFSLFSGEAEKLGNEDFRTRSVNRFLRGAILQVAKEIAA